MSRALDRASILALDDLRKELVDVPEWGDDAAVWVRALSGAERGEYMRALVSVDAKGTPRARIGEAELALAFLAMCDENGARLFTSSADLEALGQKSAAALKRIVEVAERLSALDADAVDRAVGNSEGDPNEDSSSSLRVS